MKQRNQNKKGQVARNKPTQTKNTQGIIVVPSNQQSFSAVGYRCQFKYVDEQILKNNAGNQFIYWRMRMGDLFDPNPLILTGSISGFAELAALYRRYIVNRLSVKLIIVNNETFPVTVSVAPSDIDLALAIITPAAAFNLGEYPRAQTKLLSGLAGQNRATFNMTIDLPTFVGQSGAYEDSLQYSSLVNASPAVQTFFNVTVASASNLVNGVTQYATYTYSALLSQRQTPSA